MAEAFFQKYAPKGFEPYSCGTNPSTTLNPLVVEAMQESGFDITRQRPKLLTPADLDSAAEIVNMGCMDSSNCPVLLTDKMIEWRLADPKGKSIEDVRKIRDEIESYIKKLVEYLRKNY